MGVLYFYGVDLYLSLLLVAIAFATAPAAIVMAIQEYNAEGPLTSTIMAVVGIDDAIALILFSLVNPIAYFLYSNKGSLLLTDSIIKALEEISGALMVSFSSLLANMMIGFTYKNFSQKTWG